MRPFCSEYVIFNLIELYQIMLQHFYIPRRLILTIITRETEGTNNVEGFDKSLVRAGDGEGWRGTNVLAFFIAHWSQYFSRTEWSTAVIRDQVRARSWSSEILAGSLCHKGAYNRTFPFMEATYPLCHKEPVRSKQATRGFGCDESVLYGIRVLV